MDVSGKVIVSDLQKGTSKSGREWQKKVFVIEFNEGTYTRRLAFDLFGEDKINNYPFKKGQNVTVSFDIESTEWNGRWFTSLNAYRVVPFDPKATPNTSIVSQSTEIHQDPTDELPF